MNNILRRTLESLCLILIFTLIGCKEEKKDAYSKVSYDYTNSKFVGSETCRECHQEATKKWEGSHHDMAMKIADSTTVLGDFSNTEFTHNGVKTKFYKKADAYYVTTANKEGEYEEYKIVYTYGITPLQQYIVAFPKGAYQCLLTAWDAVERKWFHLQKDVNLEHGEWLNWTGGASNWNTMCADCHSTDLKKNFNRESESYSTTFSEINVSCEACHGPASAHVAHYKNPIGDEEAPKMYMHTNMDSKELVDKCARCHSRRTQITDYFDYNGTFSDHYIPRILEAPIYELDGQIKDEDYVYASFVQSKMYHNGVSCNDCHDVHSLKLKKKGNDLCLNCHLPKYNTQEHHYHKEGTKPAECISCHMDGKIYMGNDYRRDHSFRIPRPDQSQKYGTPNACVTCHTDKTNEWASRAIVKNYGTERADHFSDYLLEGSLGNKQALLRLLESNTYPAIARATSMSHLINQGATRKEIEIIALKLKDSSAMLRREAIVSIEKTRDVSFKKHILPLLNDPIRSVRMAAASYFITLKIEPKNDVYFRKANQEYLDFLELNSDFASGQLQIAEYYKVKGEFELAIKAYERAIEIDSYYNVARMNLALLFYQINEPTKSIDLYAKVIALEPDFGYSYYMLGLLYNEIQQPKLALKYMALATEKDSTNLNAYYNYALMLQGDNKMSRSLKVLQSAVSKFPGNEKLLYAKLIAELNSGAMEDAFQSCLSLLELKPGNKTYIQIMQQLQSKR